jgi:YVTN family beta-propeller protein
MHSRLMGTELSTGPRRQNSRYCGILSAGSLIVALGMLLAAFRAAPFAGETGIAPFAAHFRGPVSLILADDGKTLLAANRRAGSISTVDATAGRVVGEVSIGKSLSALAAVPGGQFLLATDEAAHELVLISRQENSLQTVARLPVDEYPVSIRVSPDGKQSYVASLWSRRLSIINLQLDADGKMPAGLALASVIPLPFAPRQQLLVEDGKRLLVADSFGGKLAVIDTASGAIEAIRQLPAHNIRGLALNADGSRLLISHQILNALARTTPDDVHWGMLMGNVVRSLKLTNVLDKEADILRGSLAHPIGESGNAAADPAAIALTAGGEIAVVMSGIGEIGFFPEDDSAFRRVSLGGRPTELAVSPDARRVFVADELSDTISVVDVKEARRTAEISLGPLPELSLADRGERLFYDGRLSHDGWMSCHSCHTDGHSNGLLNDNLGDGGFGAPKRVLSLLGVGRTGPWAWNGEMAELDAQIKKSIETTMRGKKPKDDQVEALAAFVRTLTPAPPLNPKSQSDQEAIKRGREIFAERQCGRCHTPPEYTSEATYDVGLKDQFNYAKFNPPSLRGVSQRDALFHDNRAANLEEVFTRFKHQIEGELPEKDVADLAAFLRSL